jgi:hypothetical protein
MHEHWEVEVDDATVAYILEARKHFEDLRQVAAQLAGLLVLTASGAKSAGPEHPVLDAAEQLFRETADAIRRLPVTSRARQHHHYVLQAASLLQMSLSAARRGVDIDPPLVPLKAAYTQLQRAAEELPGFEMISFDQACFSAAKATTAKSR